LSENGICAELCVEKLNQWLSLELNPCSPEALATIVDKVNSDSKARGVFDRFVAEYSFKPSTQAGGYTPVWGDHLAVTIANAQDGDRLSVKLVSEQLQNHNVSNQLFVGKMCTWIGLDGADQLSTLVDAMNDTGRAMGLFKNFLREYGSFTEGAPASAL